MSWHLPASRPPDLPLGMGWGRRGPVLLPLLGGRAGGPGGDSAGLSAAGAGAHRTGPVGAAARGCALAPGGEAAEGGTGGIRSLHGNSCTDSGGWAGARGAGEEEETAGRRGRGAGRRRSARARRGASSDCGRARTRSRALLPSSLRFSRPLPARSLLLAGSPPLPAAPKPRCRPPGAGSAPEPTLRRARALPSEALPRPSPGLCSRVGWALLLSPPPPEQKDNGGFVPTASESQFHV